VILKIYDAMAEAARTGEPYGTRLNPPPADKRVAPGVGEWRGGESSVMRPIDGNMAIRDVTSKETT
jgi:hypothetical protein